MKNKINRIKAIVTEQAKDEGLWFNAKFATEAYLQKELRRLHQVIEDEFGDCKEII